jgi:glycosyltransferase involved in cell wall biosynthesis
MKLMMLVTRRQKRGAEISAANLSVQLCGLGCDVVYVGLYKPPADSLIVGKVKTEDLGGSDSYLFSLEKLNHILQLVKRYEIDIIQSNGADTLRYAVAVKLLKPKVKVIYRNISVISYWIGKSTIKKIYNNILFKYVSKVVSVGSIAASDFLKTIQYPSSDVTVIRRGIPHKPVDKMFAWQKLLAEFKISKEHILLIWAGSITAEKNPLLVIDIMREFKNVNARYVLIMAGTGTMENEVISSINDHKLDNIFLVGNRSDIHDLLAGSHLLILTSLVEGVPGVVLEAAAQQTPAVAHNIGGVSEAILDGETGILINDLDSKKFTKAIIELTSSAERYRSMGVKAHNRIFQDFNEQKNAGEFIKLYQSLFSSI